MEDSTTTSSSGPSPSGASRSTKKLSAKKFIFHSQSPPNISIMTTDDDETEGVKVGVSVDDLDPDDPLNPLTVLIPERMEASYGLYHWPGATLLAWYLFQHRTKLKGKRILELGAGTSLPGILAALCGATVTLSDSAKLPHCLTQAQRSIHANGLTGKVKVIGVTWGHFLADLTELSGSLDLILGSDCFYDPGVFEDLLSTVAFLLETNPGAKFLSTYQERSSDWSIESLLTKWSLQCKHVPLSDLANSCQIDLGALNQGHTIHLLEITPRLDLS